VLFDSVVNSRWFMRTSIILFLNKVDLFRQKLGRSPLSNYFPDYSGGNDINRASKYLLWRFNQVNRAHLNLYPHLTQATDTSNIRLVFAAVKETILQNALKDSGILWVKPNVTNDLINNGAIFRFWSFLGLAHWHSDLLGLGQAFAWIAELFRSGRFGVAVLPRLTGWYLLCSLQLHDVGEVERELLRSSLRGSHALHTTRSISSIWGFVLWSTCTTKIIIHDGKGDEGKGHGNRFQTVYPDVISSQWSGDGDLRRRSSKGFTWHHLMCHINMAHTCRNLSTCIKNGNENGKFLINLKARIDSFESSSTLCNGCPLTSSVARCSMTAYTRDTI